MKQISKLTGLALATAAFLTLTIAPSTVASGADSKCNPTHPFLGCVHMHWNDGFHDCWQNGNEWRCDFTLRISAVGWSDAYVPGILNSDVGGCSWPHTVSGSAFEVLNGARGCEATGDKEWTGFFVNLGQSCYTYTENQFAASVLPGAVGLTIKFDYKICWGQQGQAINFRRA